MADVRVEDNTGACIDAMTQAALRALEIIGGKAESYAKGLCAPRGPKGNKMPNDITAPLRNSITHKVDSAKMTVVVGSNQPMAAYVELGTGKAYKPPPEWIQNAVKKGTHSGLDHWIFYDKKEKKFKIGLPMAPTPFIQPAIKNHIDEYKHVLETELKGE